MKKIFEENWVLFIVLGYVVIGGGVAMGLTLFDVFYR